jgi:hypothetical protein
LTVGPLGKRSCEFTALARQLLVTIPASKAKKKIALKPPWSQTLTFEASVLFLSYFSVRNLYYLLYIILAKYSLAVRVLSKVTSFPTWRETHRAEKSEGYFDFKHLKIYLISLYTSCFIATPKYLEPLSLKNYICVVALAPDLQKVSLCGVIEFLHYSSTIELLSLLIPINRFYLSSAGLLLC